MFLESVESLPSKDFEFFISKKPSSDLDGVLADTRTYVVNRCNELLGINRNPTDIQEWHCVRTWALESGWDYDKANKLEQQLWYTPDELWKVEPLLGAYELIDYYHSLGVKLPIITSRDPSLRDVTYEWVDDKFGLDKVELYMQKTREMDGGIFKAWMIKLMNRDLHYEDNGSHAKTILDYTDARVCLLSDIGDTDEYLVKGKLIRIRGIGQKAANLEAISAMLKDTKNNYNVAQY